MVARQQHTGRDRRGDVNLWRDETRYGYGRCQEFCVLRSVKNLS
jgi:hypothetical protein